MLKMKGIFVSFVYIFLFLPLTSYSQIYYEESPYSEDGYASYEDDSSYSTAEESFPSYETDDPFYYPKNHHARERRKSGAYEIDGSPYATENAPIPQFINPPSEKLILINPNRHAWGAYTANGRLIRWGIATAGSGWCRDLGRSCRTKAGQFRIYTLGDESCISSKFPLGEGGAPMPYCMFFNGGQAIHGSNEVVSANVSHGCVRLHVSDARWLRYQFVESPNASNRFRGTRVVILPY